MLAYCTHILTKIERSDGRCDRISPTVVVAAIYMSSGTVLVDGNDEVIMQQDGLLSPLRLGKLLVKFLRL